MKRNSPFSMRPHKDSSGYGNLFEDEELEEVAPQRKMNFLEREVRPEDTLQSISLEFNVSVADLKRANNIHKENEIHARKTLKVPHRPHSLLLESKFFSDENAIELSSPPSKSTSKSRGEAAVLVDLVNSATIAESIPMTTLSSPATPPEEDDETEVLLRNGSQSPDLTPLHCSGADGDPSWGVLLLVVFCIGIGGPVVYMWYFWYHIEKHSSRPPHI